MFKHKTNEERKQEGDVSKSAPESTPHVHNAWEEDDHPAVDAPAEPGAIPRTRDEHNDDKNDPYEDREKK